MNFTSGTISNPKLYSLGEQVLGDVTLSKLSNVIIQGGTFSTLNITGCSNITVFASVIKAPEFPTSNGSGIRIYNSNLCSVSNCLLEGSIATKAGVNPKTTSVLDKTGNVLGLPCGKGINIGPTCSNIIISNNVIRKFHKGIVIGGNSITVQYNKITELRTTPISGAPGDNCQILHNLTSYSTPFSYGGNGDHGDRLHLWTTTKPVKGLVIRYNSFSQGVGAPMLGIYLDDNGKNLGFESPIITNNIIVDANAQGMTLEKVYGSASNPAIIANNTLTWSGFGDKIKNTPRFYVTLGCRYLNFVENKGAVTFSKYITQTDKSTITIK